MQPAAAPCMTGAFSFITFYNAQHVSMLHARSNLFESAGMSLPPWRVDSMDRMHTSPSHLRTLDARTQSVLWDDVFVSVFKMNSEDSLDQQATNPRRRQGRYAGESDHPQRRKLPIPGIPNFQDNPRSFTCQQSTGCLKCCTCWPFITCYNML